MHGCVPCQVSSVSSLELRLRLDVQYAHRGLQERWLYVCDGGTTFCTLACCRSCWPGGW